MICISLNDVFFAAQHVFKVPCSPQCTVASTRGLDAQVFRLTGMSWLVAASTSGSKEAREAGERPSSSDSSPNPFKRLALVFLRLGLRCLRLLQTAARGVLQALARAVAHLKSG